MSVEERNLTNLVEHPLMCVCVCECDGIDVCVRACVRDRARRGGKHTDDCVSGVTVSQQSESFCLCVCVYYAPPWWYFLATGCVYFAFSVFPFLVRTEVQRPGVFSLRSPHRKCSTGPAVFLQHGLATLWKEAASLFKT